MHFRVIALTGGGQHRSLFPPLFLARRVALSPSLPFPSTNVVWLIGWRGYVDFLISWLFFFFLIRLLESMGKWFLAKRERGSAARELHLVNTRVTRTRERGEVVVRCKKRCSSSPFSTLQLFPPELTSSPSLAETFVNVEGALCVTTCRATR